jgi:hypothetical protein
MKYAIELLQTALRNEILAQNDALNYFLCGHAYDNKTGSHATSEAFKESQRLADERIPQLRDAISALTEMEMQSD